MEKNKIKINMLLNAIKGLMSIIFPLITFPYVSKVLGPDSVGQYNFAQSIVSYLVLLAGLGISTYAIREGARVRNDQKEISLFVSEVFSINVLFTALAYIVLFILLITVAKFKDYNVLLIILSSRIAFITLGVDWIYSVYEDYFYITARSILFQIISLILLILFVHNSNDLYIYAVITVISSVGANLLNYWHSRKYIRFKFTTKIDWKKHFQPILVLFSMTIAVTIYTSSDTTILGFLCDDKTVGIYTVSTKIYGIAKTLLSAVIVVSIPRLSANLGEGKFEDFKLVAADIYKTLITVLLPAIVGIICLSEQIVLIVSNEEYASATTSLILLAIAVFFCMVAWFWGQCILVPYRKENYVFKVTVFSAFINIILNFLLIPYWGANAAALTTIIAEAFAFIFCQHKGKQFIKLSGIIQVYMKSMLGSIFIIIISVLKQNLSAGLGSFAIIVIASVIVYFIIEILLKNEAVYGIINIIKKKISKL